jgi:hypothetical protein
VGFDAEPYKHFAKTIFPRVGSTVQTILAGLRVLELARQSSTCIDKPYRGVFVAPGPIYDINKDVLAELTESISTFEEYLDRLLLASSDTTIGKNEFSSLLEEFKENAVHLRSDYLQTVAEKDILGEFKTGKPSGIVLWPKGSVRTASIGSTTGITVKVQEPWEREIGEENAKKPK